MSGDPLTLHLMRHGVPEQAGLLFGHLDAPPEKSGLALCMERARPLPFTRIISSDLARASLPAALLAEQRNVAHHRDARWRELDFGAWEGCDPATLPAADLAAFWDDPDTNPPPAGERWTNLRARVAAALADIDDAALVIAHAGAIRAALSILCGLDYRQGWAVDLPYGAVVSLRVWPGNPASAQITGLVT